MNTPLTLTEVSKLIDELPTEEAMNDDRIQEFITRIEEMGKEILGHKKECGQYVEDASGFLCAAVVAECLNGINPEDRIIAMAMMSTPRIFKLIFGYSFIYAVGLCAAEELR